MAQTIDAMVSMWVLVDIDNSRHPMMPAKGRLERAASKT